MRYSRESPEELATIHIAGTNGKGSTSHMLASIFQEKGLKVGLFTSPHLKDFRERILINGKKIPKGYITAFVKRYFDEFEKLGLSFFEMVTGLAFQYFRESGVDIAVIETGLGGRLDSTNIITPLVSVITNISFDHMQFLGDTLQKIAGEKAGIIKPGVPVVIGETQEEIRHVFTRKAKETASPLLFADSLYSPDRYPITPPYKKQIVINIFRKKELFLKGLHSPLMGIYQMKNIITVMGAVEMLSIAGVFITGDEIKRGIRNVTRNTHFAGRWQTISYSPLTICDTGHNEAGLKEIVSQLNSMSFHRLHFVFGVVSDKAIDKMLALLPENAVYYFCQARLPRALDQYELKRRAELAGLKGDAYASVMEALSAARKNAAPDDLIFIGGSTFVVAEAL